VNDTESSKGTLARARRPARVTHTLREVTVARVDRDARSRLVTIVARVVVRSRARADNDARKGGGAVARAHRFIIIGADAAAGACVSDRPNGD